MPLRHVSEVEWLAYVRALGRRVASLRAELGMSQLELAARAGIADNSVKLIEVGKSSWDGDRQRPANPRLDTLCLLAHALGITPAELLEPLGPPATPRVPGRHEPGVRPRPRRVTPDDR